MGNVYIGDANSKARELKNAYIGVDGVARKVKQIYIGDANGIARLAWTADFLCKTCNNNFDFFFCNKNFVNK